MNKNRLFTNLKVRGDILKCLSCKQYNKCKYSYIGMIVGGTAEDCEFLDKAYDEELLSKLIDSRNLNKVTIDYGLGKVEIDRDLAEKLNYNLMLMATYELRDEIVLDVDYINFDPIVYASTIMRFCDLAVEMGFIEPYKIITKD